MHVRAALHAWKHRTIYEGRNVFYRLFGGFKRIRHRSFRQDHPPTRAAECLMGGRRDYMEPVVERILRDACGDEAGDMSHICHEQRPYFITYVSEFLIIKLPWIP